MLYLSDLVYSVFQCSFLAQCDSYSSAINSVQSVAYPKSEVWTSSNNKSWTALDNLFIQNLDF